MMRTNRPPRARRSLDECLEHVVAAVDVTPRETVEMIEFMRHSVAKTPNPRNPSTYLRRKQCTFLLPGMKEYDIKQYNQHFVSNMDAWPPLVQRIYAAVAARCAHPTLYTGVHVNLYEDGGVGVDPHFDKEESMLAGQPIFSVTLLEDPTTPRNFCVYHNDKTKIRDIPLGHGDLLVMNGMQDDFLHGVEKQRPFAAFRPRLNFTVRAFRTIE